MKNAEKGIWKRSLLAVAIITPALFAMGCSDDNDDIPIPPGHGSSVSGTAYDGYLANARVCVDVNLNKACNSGEPTTFTDANGYFEINNLSARQAQLPLVLEATSSTTDSDTGNTVDPELKFTAPAGSKAISAFSTIVQSRIETQLATGAGGSLEDLRNQAAADLASDLGLSGIDLLSYDPIAVKNDAGASEADRRGAAILHITNQVLTQQIVELRPQAEANGGGSQDEAAFAATIKKLDPVDVKDATENDTSGLSTADLITSADKDTVVTATPPPVPTASDVADAADEDEAADDAIEDKIGDDDGDDGTGGTGGTGGSGGTV